MTRGSSRTSGNGTTGTVLERIVEVADGVHLVHGTNVNWTVLTSPGEPGCTLVDTGYRGDRGLLVGSLAALGHSPGDVAAVLVTHGHVDHVGSAGWLAEEHGVPVLAGRDELPHLRGDVVEQIGTLDFLANARTRAGARWIAQTLWALRGELHPRIPSAAAYDGHGATGSSPTPLDLPGRPVAVPTPGHTSGHTAWWLPGPRVMVTGDALVTGHALLGTDGPQLVPAAFHHDRTAAEDALALLVAAVEADGPGTEVTLVPGHGGPWRGRVGEAVARARGQRRV